MQGEQKGTAEVIGFLIVVLLFFVMLLIGVGCFD